MKNITFKIDGARLKFFKNQDEIEVVLNTGIYEYENLKDIPSLAKGVYIVEIKPDIKEN